MTNYLKDICLFKYLSCNTKVYIVFAADFMKNNFLNTNFYQVFFVKNMIRPETFL